MSRLKRLVIQCSKSTTDVRGGTMGSRGAGAANFLLTGNSPGAAHPYDGVFRSYAEYDLDAAVADKVPNGWGGIKAIRQSYFSYYTRQVEDTGPPPSNQSYFATGGDAKLRLSRLTTDAHYGNLGDGLQEAHPPDTVAQSHWNDADLSGINPFTDTSTGSWEEFVSPNEQGETRVRANSLVGAWAPAAAGGHPVYYYDPDQGAALIAGGGHDNHGVLMRAPDENATSLQAEFYSNSAAAGYHPTLTILYEPWNPTPDKPSIISPKGGTKPDFEFRAYVPEPDSSDQIASVDIEVRDADNGGGTKLWSPNVKRSVSWPEGELRRENPGQPTLPSGGQLYWKCRSTTSGGAQSAWTDWQVFTILRDRPTITPIPIGRVDDFTDVRLAASWTTPLGAPKVFGYEVELAPRLPDGHPLWRSPIWERTEQPPPPEVITEAAASVPNQPSAPDGGAPMPGGAPQPNAPGGPYDVGIFKVFGTTAQRDAVRDTFNNHCTYPTSLVQDRMQSLTGTRRPQYRFVDIAATFPFFTRTVWGYTPVPGNVMYIEKTLNAARMRETILSEFSHQVDRFGISNKQRLKIKDLMGVPTKVDWRPTPSPANWKDIPAECFMVCFIGIFSDITMLVTGFKYGLNHNKADIKGILLKGYNPPPPPQCDPGFHYDPNTETCVPDTVVPPGTGSIDSPYRGPVLPEGLYSLRWRLWDELVEYSTWAYDHSIEVVTTPVGDTDITYDDPDIGYDDPNVFFDGAAEVPIPKIEIDHSARGAAINVRARIILRDLDQPTHDEGDVQAVNPGAGEYSRGPGVVKAVIYDPQHLGMSRYAATPGELHFTLARTHPQISECLAYVRHYDLQVMDKYGDWQTKSEGLLHDVDLSSEDAIIYGWDYLGLLALSVESAHTPDSNDNAAIDETDPKKAKGSKYIQKDISFIIYDQLERGIADVDSPIGWIEIGTPRDDLPEPTTIYASFVQRLTFIRGLLDSYNAGAGNRSRVVAKRDAADGNKVKFYVMEDSGNDRADLRLEYGSLLQGFELIPYGDFAVKVLGIGHRPLNIKPLYAARTASGMDTQVWGNIAKTAIWQDIADEADLTRRVLQRAAEFARIGKATALALRVRGLDVLDGWDITDAIPLAINHGPIETRWWTPDTNDLTWWVIWGIEWQLEPDGHDELTLIVRPRVDNAKPLPDTANHPLLKFVEQHTTAEWAVPAPGGGGDGGGGGDDLLLGIDDSANVTLNALKSQGGDFYIRKLTQGTYWEYASPGSGGAVAQIAAAKAKGMVVGFYHFLTRIEQLDGSGDVSWNDGNAQCDWFISNLPGKSPEGYLCALDVETNPGGNDVTHNGQKFSGKSHPHWKQIIDFVNRWKAKFPDHPLLIYSSKAMWTVIAPGKDIKGVFANCFAWNVSREYSGLLKNVPQTAIHNSGFWHPVGWGGFSTAKMLQFSSGIRLGDGKGATDGDAFRGTRDDLLQFTTSAIPVDPVPIIDHAQYMAGYNAETAAIAAAVPGITAAGADPDFVAGIAEAKADTLATLSILTLDDTP